MTNLDKIKEVLHEKSASLVTYKDGIINEYYNRGIRDLIEVLSKDENALRGAIVADTTIGKVAASIMVKAGVAGVYADKISKIAIPVLEENNVKYEYGEKLDYIQNRDKTGMCPMEARFKEEKDIEKIYKEYIKR